jgi:hypothetical protein
MPASRADAGVFMPANWRLFGRKPSRKGNRRRHGPSWQDPDHGKASPLAGRQSGAFRLLPFRDCPQERFGLCALESAASVLPAAGADSFPDDGQGFHRFPASQAARSSSPCPAALARPLSRMPARAGLARRKRFRPSPPIWQAARHLAMKAAGDSSCALGTAGPSCGQREGGPACRTPGMILLNMHARGGTPAAGNQSHEDPGRKTAALPAI